jgi:hypothetical protein
MELTGALLPLGTTIVLPGLIVILLIILVIWLIF